MVSFLFGSSVCLIYYHKSAADSEKLLSDMKILNVVSNSPTYVPTIPQIFWPEFSAMAEISTDFKLWYQKLVSWKKMNLSRWFWAFVSFLGEIGAVAVHFFSMVSLLTWEFLFLTGPIWARTVFCIDIVNTILICVVKKHLPHMYMIFVGGQRKQLCSSILQSYINFQHF